MGTPRGNVNGYASMTTGKFREFARAVLRSLPDDLDPTTAHWWIENQESLRKTLREALAPDYKFAGNTYPLSVDYGRSVEDAVKAGRYDWTDSGITSKNFPTERSGMVEVVVELIHFKRYVSTCKVLREFDRMGYRPADLHILLALAEKYAEVQRGFQIVALGSVWRSQDCISDAPCLGGDGSERYLYLDWVDDYWDEVDWFAAVRK